MDFDEPIWTCNPAVSSRWRTPQTGEVDLYKHTAIESGAQLVITTGWPTHQLLYNGGTIDNYGTAFALTANANENAGVVLDSSEGTVNNLSGGVIEVDFINGGTPPEIQGDLNNAGRIFVNYNLTYNSGTLDNTGIITIASGQTLTVDNSGTLIQGSGGTITIASGSTLLVDDGGTMTVASGGAITIVAGAALTVDDGGTLNNAGAITIASGQTLMVASGGEVELRRMPPRASSAWGPKPPWGLSRSTAGWMSTSVR